MDAKGTNTGLGLVQQIETLTLISAPKKGV